MYGVNMLKLKQNGRHYPDDIFKCIFFNENVWISIKIWLKLIPKDPINNIPLLVQIMAWRQSGDKQLSEPMMVRLSMHLCIMIFFLKLIVACILCVIYVREDNDSNV